MAHFLSKNSNVCLAMLTYSNAKIFNLYFLVQTQYMLSYVKLRICNKLSACDENE